MMSKPVALITGASRGLGAELAQTLSQTHHIIAISRTIGALEALDDKIKKCAGALTSFCDSFSFLNPSNC